MALVAPDPDSGTPEGAQMYLRELSSLLELHMLRNGDQMRRATNTCADAIAGGNLAHLFGVGHSALPVLELFPRYGSYLGFNPIVDPRLLWSGIGTPGGVPGMRYLEDADGYADVLLRTVPIMSGDVLVVFSHSLRGTVVQQAIQYARSRGCPVVAVSSSATQASRAPGGPSVAEVSSGVDILLDTGVPATDALVHIAGAEARLGAGSTVVATALGLALVCAVGEELVSRGQKLVQSVRSGSGLNEGDWAFYEGFENQLRAAWRRS